VAAFFTCCAGEYPAIYAGNYIHVVFGDRVNELQAVAGLHGLEARVYGKV
jgi:hypothetical protein